MNFFKIRTLMAPMIIVLLLSGCGGGGGGTSTTSTVDENLQLETTVLSTPLVQQNSEPSISEPSISEPMTESEPTISEPTISEPTISEPTISQPTISQPSISQPSISQPTMEQISLPEPNIQTSESVTVCKTGPAVQEGIVKDKISNIGIEGVKVTINGCSTTTNSNGYYILNNLTEDDKASVNFRKEGYFSGSMKIQIHELSGDNTPSPNFIEYGMSAYSSSWDNGRPWTYDSQKGASGGAVEISASSTYNDSIKSLHTGIVSARWFFKDPMTVEGRDIFPGSFEGINTNGVLVPFIAYGLMSIELKDEHNTPLSVSDNITLILSAISGTTDNTVPLWYYDYNVGQWIEEGYAERQPDGTYKAEITRVGTWSMSKPIEEDVAIYRGHIIDQDGVPLSEVRLQAVGDNWISNDLSTDENGLFEIKVVPDSSFQLKAYNYKEKYGAEYAGVIPGIGSGNIVED